MFFSLVPVNLVGRKRFVERLWREFFFRPFAVVGSQIGEGKKKKLETMTMSGFRVLGFGIWSATSCQECMVDQLRT